MSETTLVGRRAPAPVSSLLLAALMAGNLKLGPDVSTLLEFLAFRKSFRT
ncbi:hypothetical protein JNUCC0626_48290 [Lentzea sp. JNUCC 0626]